MYNNKNIKINEIYNMDCIEGMKQLQDNSVDAIITDPPYLYLKHKLDRDFNEEAVFEQWDRLLKDDGFIVIFGRGISFYRWNVKLSELGFEFKEEVIWNKRYISNPTGKLMRVHETVSLLTKKGKLNKVRVPYIEKKQFDLAGLENDVKRIKSAVGNEKSLNNILDFVARKNEGVYEDKPRKKSITVGSDLKSKDRAVGTFKAVRDGNVESSIITVNSERYKAAHPTQKPVRLMERLMNLVTNDNDVVLDPFSGSGSTALAAQNLNRKYVGFEIDEEYYSKSLERIKENSKRVHQGIYEV